MLSPARGSGTAHAAAARSTVDNNSDTPTPRKRSAITSDQSDDETTSPLTAAVQMPKRRRPIGKEKAHEGAAAARAPRSKRPTPMDLAWRQVALDEKEGRLPEYVAETETEKRMERMSERARRDGTELRRIRQLNREGNEDAYLDALGEYLRSHRKERTQQKNAKKGKNALESNKKRRKMGRSSVSSSRRSGLGGESSDASSSSSESRSSIASESDMRKTKNVGSSEVKEAEMSVELSLVISVLADLLASVCSLRITVSRSPTWRALISSNHGRA